MEAICHLNWKETVMESPHIHSVTFYQRPADKWGPAEREIYIQVYQQDQDAARTSPLR